MKKGYKIDFTMGTVTMTKAFSRQAEIYGSDAYSLIIKLRKDFPNMRFITRTPPKRKCPDRLTYNNMLTFIQCQNNADTFVKQFNQACEIAKGQGGNAYQNTRNWFLSTFPNYKETPCFDDNGAMINDFTRIKEVKEQPLPIKKSA